MPNSINFYKGLFLHVFLVRIKVPWYNSDLSKLEWTLLSFSFNYICEKLFSIPVTEYVSFSHQAETLKTNLLGLISMFSKYYFKTGAICFLFSSSHVFTALEFDSNHFGILLWKIVKPCGYNEIKPPIGKIFRKYKPIRNFFVMSQKQLPCSFSNNVYDNYKKVSCSKGIKNAITWKPLFRRKSTVLGKLDLSEAITWQFFKSLSLRL